MADCLGNREDHCCYLGPHGVCQFLEERPNEARRWVCSLREELGSWEAVHTDARYVATIKPILLDLKLTVDCGDWPLPGEKCWTCGVIG